MARSNVILDLTGEVCPVPLVKTRRALDKMEKGDILEVIVTDEESKVNIIMAAKELGMEIAKIGTNDGKWRIIIRKRK